MPKRLFIPPELLIRHPGLTLREIRSILMVVLNSKSNKLRQSNIADIKIQGLGRIKSHGNKKKKWLKKALIKDKKRKRMIKRKKDLEINNLLF